MAACTRGLPGSRSDSQMALEPWLDRAQEVTWASLAPDTRVSYVNKIQEFLSFWRASGVSNLWPVPVEHLMRFLLSLHNRGLSSRLLSLYLAAVAFQSKALGWADTTRDFRVRRMIKGFKRGTTQQADGRKPITPNILRGLSRAYSSICHSEFEAVLFRAASFVLLFRAFCPGEVLAVSKLCPSDRALRWEDCQISGGRVSLLLRKSKTDQKRYG